jgi:hypothetical protein
MEHAIKEYTTGGQNGQNVGIFITVNNRKYTAFKPPQY